MTIEIVDDDQQDALLRAFAEGLTQLCGLFGELDRELMADALVSGGVEILRRRDGVQVAADRLREAADVVELKNPVERH